MLTMLVAGIRAAWLDGWPWVPASGLIPAVGLLLFPTARLPSRRWRPVLWAGCAVAAVLAVSILFGRDLLDFPDRPNPTALPEPVGSVLQDLGLVIAFMAPLSTLGAFSLH
jgi:hypothetical protein